MAELQVVSAAFGLADHALKLARLLQKLAKARSEAKDLYDDTAQLHSLAARVASVLKNRHQNDRLSSGSVAKQNVNETLQSIASSIASCKRAVLIIHRTVRPLAEESENTWIKRVKYVWSSDLIQGQEKLIVLHLQLLGVNLQILQGLDQAEMMKKINSILNYSHHLQSNADEEQNIVVRSMAKTDAGDQSRGKIDTSDVLAGPSGASDDGNGADQLEPTSPMSKEEQEDITGKAFPQYLETDGASLAVAVRRQEANEVEQLLAAGLDIAIKDADDWTLIHHASYNLDQATLTHLLSDPERLPPGFIDAPTKRGDTALMFAAKYAEDPASYGVVQQLIAAGCDVNIVNKGETNRDALYYIVEHSKTPNRLKLAELLVQEHNARIDLVQQAFPKGVKEWPCLRKATGETAVEDADED